MDKKRRIKRFLYKYFGYELSQMKWFRKWYGGEWSYIIVKDMPYLELWVKGKPFVVVEHVLKTERWD